MATEQLTDRSAERQLRQACAELDRRLREGEACRAEQYLQSLPQLTDDAEAVLELIYTEYRTREQLGEKIDLSEWYDRFPQWRENLERLFELDGLIGGTEHEQSRFAETPVTGLSPWNSHEQVPPQRRLGPYELIEQVAQGGMGVVYRARHMVLNRVVAVKMILSGHASPLELARFRQEAEAAARLQHPNIVQIYEVGEQNGCPFLAMEFVEGQSLKERLAQSPLPSRTAAELIERIARAIHYAHQRGVVHRDLKPANMLLARSDALRGVRLGGADESEHYEPKITDFGLAKQLRLQDQSEQATVLTQTGALLGTPSYMAPEQAGGKNEAVGPQTDVYALGVMLYEMVTGRVPFRGETMLETLEHVRSQEPVPPGRLQPKLPRDLETICLKCLEKQPAARYATAEALAEDLRRFLNGESTEARPSFWWERAAKWAKRRPAIASLIAALGVVAALGIAGILSQWLRAENSLVRAENSLIAATAAYKNANLAREKADLARQAEEDQRKRVERLLYSHDVVLAHHEYLSNNTERARQLLDGCRADLRGWEWRYLKRLCNADVMTLKGHSLPVWCVAWSPNGKLIASSSAMWQVDRQGEVKVWNATTGAEVFTLRGHPREIYCVAFSPDEKTLASGGVIGTAARFGVKLWDLSTGAEIRSISRVGNVMSVAFSPSGKLLALGSSDGKVRLCDPETAKVERTLSGHTDRVFSVAFSPDGSRLASGGGHDHTARVWDVSDGRELSVIAAGDDVRHVSFSPDGRRLAISTYMGRIKIWDIVRNVEVASHLYRDLSPHAVYGPDARSMAVVGGGGLVQVWHTISGEGQRTFHGHSSVTINAAFSPDGRRLATASADHTIKVWDLTSDPEPRSIGISDATMRGLGYSPDGLLLALVTGPDRPSARKPSMQLWDITRGTQLPAFPEVTHHLTSVAFSPDGKQLVTGSVNKAVQLWDVDTRRLVRTFEGHTEPVMSVGFSPDGHRLISGSSDKTVKVWDTETAQLVFSVDAHAAKVTCVAYSPDGKHIVSASSDGTATIRDATDGRGLVALRGHTQAIRRLVFSHDGQFLAAAGDDTIISLWDVPGALAAHQESQPSRTLRGHNESVSGIDFSPDDQRLVSVAYDHRLKLWDVTTGQEALTIRELAAPESQVLFCPDGQRIVMSSHGLKVFDLAGEQYPTDEAREQAARRRAIAWHQKTANECERERHWFGAGFHLGQLIELEPEVQQHKLRRGIARATASAERGEWAMAAADYEKIIEMGGDSRSNWESLAVLRLAKNDAEGYRAVCTTLLDSYGDTEDAVVLNGVAWTCALSPAWSSNPELIVQLAERSVAKSAQSYSLNTLGAALFRAGSFEEAVQCLGKSLAAHGQGGVVEDWLFLAMTHTRLGHADQAREWLDKAKTWLDQVTLQFETSGTADPSFNWQNRITLPLLRREAEALLASPSSDGSQPNETPLGNR